MLLLVEQLGKSPPPLNNPSKRCCSTRRSLSGEAVLAWKRLSCLQNRCSCATPRIQVIIRGLESEAKLKKHLTGGTGNFSNFFFP